MTEPTDPRPSALQPAPGTVPPVVTEPISAEQSVVPLTAHPGNTNTPDDIGASAPRATVLTALTAAVLAVPGVVQLEPTLHTIGPRLLSPSSNDGIRLHTRGTTTSVDINISVDNTAPARQIAHAVQHAARATLSHLHTAPSITVNILSIHPAPSRPADSVLEPAGDDPRN